MRLSLTPTHKPKHSIVISLALILAGLLTLCNSVVSYANDLNEPESRSAPIEIEADQAEQNEAQGTITYKGNVLIQQADVIIRAEKVVISSEKADSSERKLNQILATGAPASFEHIPNEPEQTVYAKAGVINFNVEDSTIKLEQDAELTQSQSSVKGSRIIYNIRERKVNAKASGEDLDANRRVKTVISPDGNLLPSVR